MALELRMEPTRIWETGLPRTTPAGNPLSGVYKDNYWTARLMDATYGDQKLASALSNVLEELSPKKELLQNLAATGGTVELFVGWFFEQRRRDWP